PTRRSSDLEEDRGEESTDEEEGRGEEVDDEEGARQEGREKEGREEKRREQVAMFRLTALLLAIAASAAWAQGFPSKPIRLIVPFVPGGNVDITARTVAPALGEALGQPIVVENRPGAAGMVGAQAMMSSPADGYTLMMGSNSSLAVAPNLYPIWPYDPIWGIAPVSTP